jgi:hypothetical protein
METASAVSRSNSFHRNSASMDTQFDFEDDDDGSMNQDESIHDAMDPRQRLALTIRNWSSIADNDAHLLQEGAVHALIALASSEDQSIKKYVAGAFYHLSSRERNRKELLRMGAIAGLVVISMKPQQFSVAKMCAIAFCNLSMVVIIKVVVSNSLLRNEMKSLE